MKKSTKKVVKKISKKVVKPETPTSVLVKNPGKWVDRLLIGTPMTGLVRSEWMVARYGQTIPTNWSHSEIMQWMSSFVPLRYQVADAENIIAKACVEGKYDWLLFIESDNVLPADTFVKLNQYMIKADVPVVGGLYFTKSVPPEPMIYREPGKGYYADWKLGEKVWCRGLPFGCTLIHGSIIRELWKDAPEYMVGNTLTRRVFKHPEDVYIDPNGKDFLITQGTTDLNFCNELIRNNVLERAGWSEYQKKEFPFLVDTSIFVKHIDNEGVQWPISLSKDFLTGQKTLSDCL
jgi:hypothetical protein